jgi:hypothetical protein
VRDVREAARQSRNARLPHRLEQVERADHGPQAEEAEAMTDGDLSRGEWLGYVLSAAAVVAALALTVTGAVSGLWSGLVLAGMFLAILAVRIIVP